MFSLHSVLDSSQQLALSSGNWLSCRRLSNSLGSVLTYRGLLLSLKHGSRTHGRSVKLCPLLFLVVYLVSRFIDLPLGEELPDAETLEQWFAPQWGRTLGAQPLDNHQLSLTDSNLYRMVPQPYVTGEPTREHCLALIQPTCFFCIVLD